MRQKISKDLIREIINYPIPSVYRITVYFLLSVTSYRRGKELFFGRTHYYLVLIFTTTATTPPHRKLFFSATLFGISRYYYSI